MKILQISPQIPVPAIDGGKISILNITKSLYKLGHEIYFVAYKKHVDLESAIKELEFYSKPYILNVQTDNKILGAIINLFSRVPYNISKYYSKKLVDFLNEFLHSQKPDFVIVHNLHMGWVIDIIKTINKNIPVILRQENIEMFIMKRYHQNQKNILLKTFAYLQYLKFIRYEPQICEKFDHCIFITEYDRQRILAFNDKIKSSVISFGVNPELLKIREEISEPYSLVHIGHLDWHPNKDGLGWFMNKILPLILKEIPQIKLYIYGGGSTKNFKVPAEVQKNVEVVGFVDNIWKEVKSKELAIVPLRVGSGIRVKILEMLAIGQNIITTSVGKEGIDVVDGKHLLIADTIEDFSQKIINYFNNKYDKKVIEINGKALIEQYYTFAKVGIQLNELIKTILKDSSSRKELN